MWLFGTLGFVVETVILGAVIYIATKRIIELDKRDKLDKS